MFEQVFRNVDDVLWKEAGCTTELDYTEQTSWLLFLHILMGWSRPTVEAQLEGKKHSYILEKGFPMGYLGPLKVRMVRWMRAELPQEMT